MRNLTAEERRVATAYVEARYAHWTHSQRRKRRAEVIKRLQAATEERVEQYVQEVRACLKRSQIPV